MLEDPRSLEHILECSFREVHQSIFVLLSASRLLDEISPTEEVKTRPFPMPFTATVYICHPCHCTPFYQPITLIGPTHAHRTLLVPLILPIMSN